jgi:hypothetical protein
MEWCDVDKLGCLVDNVGMFPEATSLGVRIKFCAVFCGEELVISGYVSWLSGSVVYVRCGVRCV